MAKKSRMSILKRQREARKSEKAARKRAKRHGRSFEPRAEPLPTIRLTGDSSSAEEESRHGTLAARPGEGAD